MSLDERLSPFGSNYEREWRHDNIVLKWRQHYSSRLVIFIMNYDLLFFFLFFCFVFCFLMNLIFLQFFFHTFVLLWYFPTAILTIQFVDSLCVRICNTFFLFFYINKRLRSSLTPFRKITYVVSINLFIWCLFFLKRKKNTWNIFSNTALILKFFNFFFKYSTWNTSSIFLLNIYYLY